jgi:uncharacterized protein YebE (UPF0316 family)
MLEQVFRDPVVEHALAVDHFMLLGIEGGRVILEVLDERSGFRSLIEDLRLALIDATATIHRRVPWFEKIHLPRLLEDEGFKSAAGVGAA